MTYYITTRDIIAALHASFAASPVALCADEQHALVCAALCNAGYHALARALRDDTARSVRIDDELLDELRALVDRQLRAAHSVSNA